MCLYLLLFFNRQCLRYLATAISICFASLVLGLKVKGVRTSHSAPVLIVLPLGQICAWRGKQIWLLRYGRVFVYPHNMPELGDSQFGMLTVQIFPVCVRGL